MRVERPDVMLAMGSYASAGPVCAALLLRIPVVLHEANVLPGRAIKLFSRWATAVAGCFEETRYYLKRKEIVLTGMPMRSDLFQETKRAPDPEEQGRAMTVLVMGGSQGARKLNDVVSEALCCLYAKETDFRVVHLTGNADEEAVRLVYEQAGVPHSVHAFMQNMGKVYRMVDLAISRAGAATCAELSKFGVPALLIPHPYGALHHQMSNARAMEKKGAADVVPESDLTTPWLVEYIHERLKNPERLSAMRAAGLKRAGEGRAAEALADLVEQSGAKS